jgi:hypothetical protein
MNQAPQTPRVKPANPPIQWRQSPPCSRLNLQPRLNGWAATRATVTITAGFLLAAASQAVDPAADLVALDNGVVRLGLSRSMGAAITWISHADHPENMVNHADPGRLIQQSYYAGQMLDRRAEGQSEHWSPWNWNPIQGGGIGSWARVTRLEREDENTLFGETIPKLWDMPDEEAAAVMRQWTAFEPGMPNVIVVRCEFVSQRAENDRWEPALPRHQELPACYFTRKFDNFKSYLGDGKWRAESHPPGPPWGRAEPPRKAMACFTADGHGVAVFSPAAAQPWNFGTHRHGDSGDPAAGPCVHIAPIDLATLGPRSTYRYRYWLITGSADEIAARLDQLWTRHSQETAEITNPPEPANPATAPAPPAAATPLPPPRG